MKLLPSGWGSSQKVVDETTVPRQSPERGKATLQQSLLREKSEKNKALLRNQRLEEELAQLRRHVATKDANLTHLQNALQNAQIKHHELEAHTRELKAAQVYHTKVDTLSGAEVISLINALNAEILQTTALISDSFGFARHMTQTDEIAKAHGRISKFMGPTLARLLGAVSHSEDPLLVQIVLQGATIKLSRSIIESWDLDISGQNTKRSFAEIYRNMQESEMQAVCGRWRALTRAHAQRVAHQEADLHATMVTHVARSLAIILVAAGCTEGYEETHRTLKQKFGEPLSNIVEMATRLNKAMGEEVISADVWPLYVPSGNKFDRVTMDNFEPTGEGSEGKTILCTTALGLRRSEKVVQEGVVEFKDTILLKPTVALESIADSLERRKT